MRAGWRAAGLAPAGVSVVRVRTKSDLGGPPDPSAIPCSTVAPAGTSAVRQALTDAVSAIARPPLAPSQSRCRGHVSDALAALCRIAPAGPPELTAADLRAALDAVGAMAGAVYTNDLLDRIFSRFCIGK